MNWFQNALHLWKYKDFTLKAMVPATGIFLLHFNYWNDPHPTHGKVGGYCVMAFHYTFCEEEAKGVSCLFIEMLVWNSQQYKKISKKTHTFVGSNFRFLFCSLCLLLHYKSKFPTVPLLISCCPVKDYDCNEKGRVTKICGLVLPLTFSTLHSFFIFKDEEVIYLAAFYGSSAKE